MAEDPEALLLGETGFLKTSGPSGRTFALQPEPCAGSFNDEASSASVPIESSVLGIGGLFFVPRMPAGIGGNLPVWEII